MSETLGMCDQKCSFSLIPLTHNLFFYKYLLHNSDVPGTVLGVRETAVKKSFLRLCAPGVRKS